MDSAEASPSALMAAFFRADHHKHDHPKIFDDPFAQLFLSPSDVESIEKGLLAHVAQDIPDILTASPDHRSTVSRLLRLLAAPAPILARARYSEDRLLEAIDCGVAQYVMIGAGLETFALRYPHLQDSLQVFEIDRPSTQAFKQQALAQAGIALPPNLHLVAADLEAVSVANALRASSFKSKVSSVFSLQGVTAYLTLQAFRETVRSIRSVAAPGSLLLFSYLDGDAFRAGKASMRVRKMIEFTRSGGEPSIRGFDPPSYKRSFGRRGSISSRTLIPGNSNGDTSAGGPMAIRQPSIFTLRVRPRRTSNNRLERAGSTPAAQPDR